MADAERELEELRRDNAALEARVAELEEGFKKQLEAAMDGFVLMDADRQAAVDEAERARRDAEQAAGAKSRFLADMSHEIRTPMNAVLGMTTLLAATRLTAEQAEYVELLRASGEHLLAIINDILDYSRLEAGKLELTDASFVLAECVRAAGQLVRHGVAPGVELRHEIASDVPVAVQGDEVRLRQVLVNLLSNAAKFTARGEIVVSVTRDAGRIRFEVRDTGIGMTPQRLERVFAAFAGSAQVDGGGTGLGLAICHSLVAAMGGTIRATTELGVGSSFIFEVDLPPAAMPATSRPPRRRSRDHMPRAVPLLTHRPELSALRVLVADDDPTNRKLLVSVLGKVGVRCTAVGDGEKAVAALEGGAFDVVLLDMRMPVLDGIATARAVRERFADPPRLVAMSASVLPEERERIDPDLFTAFMPKPIDVAQLMNILARKHGSKAPARPKPAPAGDSPPNPATSTSAAAASTAEDNELLSVFRDDARRTLAEIAAATQRREQLAHRLKGAAATVGAKRLAALCHELERGGAISATQLSALLESELVALARAPGGAGDDVTAEDSDGELAGQLGEARFLALRSRYIERLPAVLAEIETACAEAAASREAATEARSLARKLTGLAGSVGFTELSRASHQLALILAEPNVDSTLVRQHLDAMVQAATTGTALAGRGSGPGDGGPGRD